MEEQEEQEEMVKEPRHRSMIQESVVGYPTDRFDSLSCFPETSNVEPGSIVLAPGLDDGEKEAYDH